MYQMYISLVLAMIGLSIGEDPKGHLLPIGSHMDKLLPIDMMNDSPYPRDFFNNYVMKNKPLLMKGVAKKFPFFNSWQNDTYLAKQFGKWRIVAEEGKKENRDLGVKYYTFRKFLSVYRNEDIYLVQDIVPHNPMAAEVCLPKCVNCGGFKKKIQTSVMWFSSGGTKSVLHNDGYENVNCLMDGKKKVVFIDPKEEKNVPIDRPDGGYSSLDVEKVDLYKYPTIKSLPMYLGEMEAGDCLYIPYRWYHHVSSSATRNMAINIWWSHTRVWDESDPCPSNLYDIPDCTHLDKITFTNPSEIYRANLFDGFKGEKSDIISIATFISNIEANLGSEDAKRIADVVDEDKNGMVSLAEVEKLSIDKIVEFFGEGETIEYTGYHGDGKVKKEVHIDVKDEL